MSSFFDPKLSSLVAYTPGEQPGDIKELIKLNTNESPFPPSPEVIKVIDRIKLENLRLYPDTQCLNLRKAVADFYKISPSQVFCSNGSDDTLAFCFHGLCPDGAVFADLTYGFYPVYAAMFNCKYEIIPVKDDLSIDIRDYAGKRGTVFIANPNAPTGAYLPPEKIRELLEQDTNRLVVVDEAYIDFGGESAICLLNEYKNLLIVQTFSKSRQLAGGRLGIAIASEELISDLETLKFSFNPYGVNNLTLAAGEAAMLDREYFEQCRRETIRIREYTSDELIKRDFTMPQSFANFIFAKPGFISGEEYYKKLREKGILVRHFKGERTGDYVRITIGSMEQMRRLIEVTDEIINGVQNDEEN